MPKTIREWVNSLPDAEYEGGKNLKKILLEGLAEEHMDWPLSDLRAATSHVWEKEIESCDWVMFMGIVGYLLRGRHSVQRYSHKYSSGYRLAQSTFSHHPEIYREISPTNPM